LKIKLYRISLIRMYKKLKLKRFEKKVHLPSKIRLIKRI
jgi:hypothetical protein